MGRDPEREALCQITGVLQSEVEEGRLSDTAKQLVNRKLEKADMSHIALEEPSEN